MDSRLIISTAYYDEDARAMLTRAFQHTFAGLPQMLLFVCIGTDRHLLDCLGPLTGTMLLEKNLDIPVFGTLKQPVHARNLVAELKIIREQYPLHTMIAVDASIGDNETPGVIKFKYGALRPGKALLKKLPPVGDYSITGLVGNRINRQPPTSSHVLSLSHVYAMARIISDAVAEWAETDERNLMN